MFDHQPSQYKRRLQTQRPNTRQFKTVYSMDVINTRAASSSLLYSHPSIYPPINPLSIHSSIHPFLYPCIYSSIHTSKNLSIHPSIHPPLFNPSIHPSLFNPSIHPSISYQSIHSSAHPSLYQFIHSSNSLSSHPSKSPTNQISP